jgi:hypothetical protein
MGGWIDAGMMAATGLGRKRAKRGRLTAEGGLRWRLGAARREGICAARLDGDAMFAALGSLGPIRVRAQIGLSE